jgi:hypothetical protein
MTLDYDFDINLNGDDPPKERTNRMSMVELREVHMQLRDLLTIGWIHPAKSPKVMTPKTKFRWSRPCMDG